MFLKEPLKIAKNLPISRLINIIEGEKELNEDTSVFSQMFISEKERDVYNKKLKINILY